MADLYDQTLNAMEVAHAELAARVNPPRAVPFGSGVVFRYTECSAQLVRTTTVKICGIRSTGASAHSSSPPKHSAIRRWLRAFSGT
jgi:hypothetical protein